MSEVAQKQNPYIGLRPFDRKDSRFFFGRREQTAELLERLHDGRFLAVLGSSGCGKSSLIRAGLIPALLGGFLVEDRDRWRIVVMKPGDDPLGNLARELCGDHLSNDREVSALVKAITEDHTEAVIRYLKPQLAGANLLLLVDQFEEIFAFRGVESIDRFLLLTPEKSGDRARRRVEAAEFVDLILDLSQQPDLAVYTTLTMRTDFLGDCDLFYGLPEAINQGRYLVPRLTRQQLRQAIEGPALLAGTPLAPRLLDRLLNKLGDRTDRLPILQHALLRTWELWRRSGGEGDVDLEHYEAAGTLTQALSNHADEALALEDVDSKAAARIFKCLTATDASYRQVRRPADLTELVAVSGKEKKEVRGILKRFEEDGRYFIYFSPDEQAENPRIDISHESLIRQWETLRIWVDEERQWRDRFNDLVKSARREAEGKEGLLQDPALGLALDWRRKVGAEQPVEIWARRYQRKPDDCEVAMHYLDRSRDAAVAATRRRERFRQVLFGTALAVIAALAGLAALAYKNSREADREARRANEAARIARAGELLATDSTRAALVLLELGESAGTVEAVLRMYRALEHRLVERELTDPELGEGREVKVLAAAFSPEGQRVLTATSVGVARLWDADSGAVAVTLQQAADCKERDHEDCWVQDAAFSPDGEKVVTASRDGTVRIWDARSGVELGAFEAHQSWVTSASFRPPDGEGLLTASDDQTARLWDWASGELQATFEGPEGRILDAAFSPDGERVVTASHDGKARIWTVVSETPPQVLVGHRDSVSAATFDSDGRFVLTASDDGTARLWDAASADHVATFSRGTDPLTSAAFSADGSQVVTASTDRSARLWDARSGRELMHLPGHQHRVAAASFGPPAVAARDRDPGSSRVLTASWDGTARLWGRPGAELRTLGAQADEVLGASFAPNGRRVAAVVGRAVRLWELAADPTQAVELGGYGEDVLTTCFDAAGSRVVAASERAVRVWDPATGAQLQAYEGFDGEIVAAAFVEDGLRVVTASDDGTVRIREAASEATVTTLEGHRESVNTASFGSQATRLVTASDDWTARIWDPVSGRELRTLEGHRSAVTSASFSADGSRIVTSSDDRTAWVWASGSGEVKARLEGHQAEVLSAAFSPDGVWVATASEDRTARIWNAVSGIEVARLVGHESAVLSASFSPDGALLVTASDDGTVRIWVAPGDALQALIRERTGVCLDPGFREQTLNEPRAVAENKELACRDCLSRYDPQGAVDLPAFRAYKECLERSR